MPLIKVISGGQTGADQAGLYAANLCGIATGGWAPKDFMTADGPAPWLKTKFNLRECPKPGYPPRTALNVSDSDGTVRFAHNFGSTGERCTLNAITKFKKPYLDIHVEVQIRRMCCEYVIAHAVDELIEFIRENNVKVLNVAGNREPKNGEAFTTVVTEFLMLSFTAFKGIEGAVQ
jgi:hypothetical protein